MQNKVTFVKRVVAYGLPILSRSRLLRWIPGSVLAREKHRFFRVAPKNRRDRGMHFTPETPTYSMRGCGGLPADAGGV